MLLFSFKKKLDLCDWQFELDSSQMPNLGQRRVVAIKEADKFLQGFGIQESPYLSPKFLSQLGLTEGSSRNSRNNINNIIRHRRLLESSSHKAAGHHRIRRTARARRNLSGLTNGRVFSSLVTSDKGQKQTVDMWVAHSRGTSKEERGGWQGKTARAKGEERR